jgi:hypothetical protein
VNQPKQNNQQNNQQKSQHNNKPNNNNKGNNNQAQKHKQNPNQQQGKNPVTSKDSRRCWTCNDTKHFCPMRKTVLKEMNSNNRVVGLGNQQGNPFLNNRFLDVCSYESK